MQLTREMLVQKSACSDQLELYSAAYPDGAEMTEQFCRNEAYRFDWNWVAERFLSPAAFEEYQRVKAAARAELLRAKVSARADLLSGRASEAVYGRAKIDARAEYERVIGATFGKLASRS
jgi:hypothetical protein